MVETEVVPGNKGELNPKPESMERQNLLSEKYLHVYKGRLLHPKRSSIQKHLWVLKMRCFPPKRLNRVISTLDPETLRRGLNRVVNHRPWDVV